MDSRLRGNDAVARRETDASISSDFFAAYAASVRTGHACVSHYAPNTNKNNKRHAWIYGMMVGAKNFSPLRCVALESTTFHTVLRHPHRVKDRTPCGVRGGAPHLPSPYSSPAAARSGCTYSSPPTESLMTSSGKSTTVNSRMASGPSSSKAMTLAAVMHLDKSAPAPPVAPK